MQKHKTIGMRLRKALKQLGLSITEVAKITGIPYPTLQDYLNDKRTPGGTNLQKLFMQLHISIDWLLTGEGPMLKGQEGSKVVDIKDIPKEQIKEFIEDFWQNADEKERHWFEVQFKKAFPEYSDWLQKKQPSQTDQNMKKGQSMT